MRGLYAILDVDFLKARDVDYVAFAERVLGTRPAVLQVRAKSTGARDTLALLRRLREPCRVANVPLFANDRPDLAVLAGCDGVHVGQDDLGIEEVRAFAPSLRIGVSTHTEDEVVRVLHARPDYVAHGPIFPTSSKDRPSPVVGLDALARAAAHCRRAGIPLVAIGGISPSNIADVARHADLAAVISALLPDEGLTGVASRATTLTASFLTLRAP
jgi:thiamine-phosphate pyrophosphorylase